MVNFSVSLLEGREVEHPAGGSMPYQEGGLPTAGGEFQNSKAIINGNRVKILAKDDVFRDGEVKIVGFRIPIHTVKLQSMAEVHNDTVLGAAQHFHRNPYG